MVPLTFPIGKSDSLSGVVDLLEGKAYLGGQTAPSDAPAAEQGTIDQLREMLVESACELDDDLINKYLEGEEITTEELVSGRAPGGARAEAVPGAGHRGRAGPSAWTRC